MLILHELQNKQQHVVNVVGEAENAGEHLWEGDLNTIILAKNLAHTAAALKHEQSNETVESWWTEVRRTPASMGRFQVRDAFKKCPPCNFPKCKEKDGGWR